MRVCWGQLQPGDDLDGFLNSQTFNSGMEPYRMRIYSLFPVALCFFSLEIFLKRSCFPAPPFSPCSIILLRLIFSPLQRDLYRTWSQKVGFNVSRQTSLQRLPSFLSLQLLTFVEKPLDEQAQSGTSACGPARRKDANAASQRQCPDWAGTGHPVGRAQACKVKICMPHRRKSGLSPND